MFDMIQVIYSSTLYVFKAGKEHMHIHYTSELTKLYETE